MSTAIAVACALCAAVLYGAGNALEHRVVNEDGATDGRLIVRLARSPLWLLGIFGDVAAFGFQAAALAYGRLLVVQPLLVCGLLVALPLSARWTGRRVPRRDLLLAVALATGLAVFLVEAAPSGGDSTASVGDWLRVGLPVAALAAVAALVAAYSRHHVRAAFLGFAAGALFGLTAALAKAFVAQIQHGVPYTAEHWEVYGLATLSVAGILLTQHGFQRSSLTASLPALEATEPVIAATLGVALLHEHINGRTTFDNVVIALSIVVVLSCVVVLARQAGREARPAVPVGAAA